ncbi:hypothetical protein HMPREF9946_00172 [Acetobacteraceae bacterium AT-5844]|nr:hypothetical protein HMPREF9946_00172 [Acetobacteraceae bacterium AT-5844]
MTDTNPPRRIAPQSGPQSWTADALSPADWMVPVGAEAAAEILASPGAGRPVLDPLLSRVVERLTHGQGFALLRGLPAQQDTQAVLAALGDRLGHRVRMQLGEGDILTVPADILLLLCRESASMTLYSAAAVHNALLKADRAALEVLYRPLPYGEDRDIPVFAVSGGVFSAWLDRAALARAVPPAALAALEAAMAAPGLALSLPLRPGDVLCVNPFLVWASRVPGLEMLALRVPGDSRLSEGAFAMLGE